MRVYFAIPVLGWLLAGPVVAAPKTDVIVLLNGDRITGEVKELARGMLKFKTDTMDTLYIQWDKILSLQSRQRLEVELANGVRYFGSAEPTSEPGQLLIQDSVESSASDA